jgi:spore coat protein U-like protein
MTRPLKRLLAILVLLAGAWWPALAHAAYSCTVTVGSISTFYNPVGSTLVTSAGFTISCTRTAGDPSSMAWTLWADTGANPQGNNRRVQLTGSYYLYNLYTSSSLNANTQWLSGPNQREFSGNLNFTGGSLFATTNGVYFLEVAAPQTVGPAGLYTDNLTATLTYGPTSQVAVGAFSINLTSITSCTLTPPTNLVFNYTSFQGAAATPSANFTVNCTTGLPYTMALDNVGPITDNAVNLTYTLGLSAAGGTGTGATQTFTVNGNMAAGQPGTCGAALCTNAAATNKTRTITVTY